jgi:hypothetical protein
MHEMLRFAGQNVSRKMDGEGLRRADCEAVSAVPGSWSDRPLSGTAASGVVLHNLSQKNDGCLARFHIFNFQVLREVLNESFIFTPSLIAMASECSQELLATQFKELLAYCTAEQQEAVYQVARND